MGRYGVGWAAARKAGGSGGLSKGERKTGRGGPPGKKKEESSVGRLDFGPRRFWKILKAFLFPILIQISNEFYTNHKLKHSMISK
jgi:hypothetical protein